MFKKQYKQELYPISKDEYIIIVFYDNNNIQSVKYYKNNVLHHDAKPAVSYYKNDVNNSLIYERFYYKGFTSKIQEGVFCNIYKV